jgi:hypothetical protein
MVIEKKNGWGRNRRTDSQSGVRQGIPNQIPDRERFGIQQTDRVLERSRNVILPFQFISPLSRGFARGEA